MRRRIAASIVAEAMHADEPQDVPRLLEAIAGVLRQLWAATPSTVLLDAQSPQLDC